MKKFLAFLMALVMMMSLSSVAFAAESEESNLGPRLVRHTVDIDVPAEGSVDLCTSDSDNSPTPSRMWASNSYIGINNGETLYTLLFTIPDRYFAFETYATGALNGYYSVALVRNVTSEYATCSNMVNGGNLKVDWISVDKNVQYQFRIYNYSGCTITVHLTYYSWA